MKILVTGASGFVGQHMMAELLKHGHDVIGTALTAGPLETSQGRVSLQALDVTDAGSCLRLVEHFNPDALVHLAGLAHTKDTEGDLPLLFDVNVGSVANLCFAMKQNHVDKHPKLALVVSSAFVYGGNIKTGLLRCDESSPLTPRGSYGHSKLAAESSARMFDGPDLSVYITRPFNHSGPGQHPSFVVAGFAERIRAAKAESTIETGSLDAKRDFTDVRDVVRGYRLILEKKPKEKTFVFGSGISRTVGSVFEEMNTISGKKLKSTIKADYLRSGDEAEIISNPTLTESVLGWKPIFSMRQSLTDIMS